jgi:hypothetical protein
VWFDSFILLLGAGTSDHLFELLYHIRILHYVSMKTLRCIEKNDARKTGVHDTGHSNYSTIQYFLHNLTFFPGNAPNGCHFYLSGVELE